MLESNSPPIVRLALIGAGAWGQNFIRTIPQVSGTRLVAVASRNPATYSRVAPDCKVEADWRKVLVPGEIHGVILATPPGPRLEILEECLRRGIPALVEKPLATTAQDAFRLRELSSEQDCPFMVDHIHLFNPAYQELRRRVSRDAPLHGPLVSIETKNGGDGPFRSDYSSYWDYGPHEVALCMDLAGGVPVRAQASELKTPNENRPVGAGNHRLELEFASGLKADCVFGNLFEVKTRILTARLQDGTRFVFDDRASAKLTRISSEGLAENLPYDAASPLVRAVQTFVQTCIPSRQRGSKDAAFAAEVTAVLDKAQKK